MDLLTNDERSAGDLERRTGLGPIQVRALSDVSALKEGSRDGGL